MFREVFNTIAKEDSEFMDEQDSDFEVCNWVLLHRLYATYPY